MWRRILGGTVDVTIGAAAAAAMVPVGLLDVSRWTPVDGLPALEHVAATLHATRSWTIAQWFVAWMPLCVLHAGFGAARIRTPGAWLAGLRVVGPDGHGASRLRGVVRGLAYVTWPATLLLAPLLVAVGPSQRGLHDVVSRTWVVRDPAAMYQRRKR